MSICIHPVTRRFPASDELWEETNLPLSVVISPLEQSPTTKKKPSTNKGPLPSLAAIPKCLSCGAPHPTKQTHYRPMHHTTLVCFLCCKTSSTTIDEQQEVRKNETLDIDVYDRTTIVDSDTVDGGNQTSTTEFALPVLDPHRFQLPAMTCPPIWWVVLDGASLSRQYWNTVTHVMEQICTATDIPPHVHIGVIAASSKKVASWDLTSTVPHILQAPLLGEGLDLCLVPADAIYLTKIQTAIRAMADTPMTMATSTTAANKGMALGVALEWIIEYMQMANHPADGQGGEDDDDDENENENDGDDDDKQHASNPQNDDDGELRYAGGRITCLLNDAPKELSKLRKKHKRRKWDIGPGGIGGECNSAENKFPVTLSKQELSDVTSDNLSKFFQVDDDNDDDHDDKDSRANNGDDVEASVAIDTIDGTGDDSDDEGDDDDDDLPQEYYESLGIKCAEAALGVDIFFLIDDEDGKTNSVLGVPFLRPLVDRSGAAGPIVLPLGGKMETIQTQILARTPWQPSMVFGTELRLRISPGFDIDATPLDDDDENEESGPLALSSHLLSGGLMGPGTAVPDEERLWAIGTCDKQTSVVVDLACDRKINDRFHATGLGELSMKFVIQTCFAYTVVEYDKETDQYYTRRKIRISSCPIPTVSTAEELYNSLDPEALAAVLFQKLSLSSYQDGLNETQSVGQNWLKALLACVYQSAEHEMEKRQEKIDQGIDIVEGQDSTFVPSERLLDQDGGTLTDDDVLLGQGHDQIRLVPLVVYSLLQCDAFRPGHASLDSRMAALIQMASMPPTILGKCIAPCLQLWSSKEDSVVLDMVDLQYETLQHVVQEQYTTDDPGLWLLFDSPQRIVVMDARLVLDDMDDYNNNNNNNNNNNKSINNTDPLELGQRLQKTIASAASSYRTEPPITYYRLHDDKPTRIAAREVLKLLLIEDSPTSAGILNFKKWKVEIADLVQEELESE